MDSVSLSGFNLCYLDGFNEMLWCKLCCPSSMSCTQSGYSCTYGVCMCVWCVYVCMCAWCMCVELHRSEITSFPRQRMKRQHFTENATHSIVGLTSIDMIIHQNQNKTVLLSSRLNRLTSAEKRFAVDVPPRLCVPSAIRPALMIPYSYPIAALQPPLGSLHPAAGRPHQVPREREQSPQGNAS